MRSLLYRTGCRRVDRPSRTPLPPGFLGGNLLLILGEAPIILILVVEVHVCAVGVCHAVGIPQGEAPYTNRGSGHVRRHAMRSGYAVASKCVAGGSPFGLIVAFGHVNGGGHHAMGDPPRCSLWTLWESASGGRSTAGDPTSALRRTERTRWNVK